ncbi:hypothetical protein [Spirillospora sp. NPDC029432]|uniref:hypothetical protein n=1 Tax=Spirillospora sp. NPDC029432 TaxID=3154599 RepID=UPI00345534CD
MRNLTRQERRLREAFLEGRRLVLGAENAEHGASWGPERVIRAEVIRDLLTGTPAAHDGGVPAVRLAGARVTGRLDLRFATVVHPLSLRSCYFDSKLDLHGVRCREIDLTGSHLPGGLRLSTAEIDGHLLLEETRIDRSVRMIAAHVAGALFMNGARLRGGRSRSTAPAFEADMLRLDADMLCKNGFQAHGEVRLPGATIGDTIHFDDARLGNGDDCALNLARVTVGGDLLGQGTFDAKGEVNLEGAEVQGRLCLEGARIRRRGDHALAADRLVVRGELRLARLRTEGGIRLLNAQVSGPVNLDTADIRNPGGVAVHASGITADGMYCRMGFTTEGEIRLSGARITGPLDFRGAILDDGGGLSLGCWYVTARELILLLARPVNGRVDLRYAELGLFNYSPEALPAELRLDGLAYNAIAPAGNVRNGLGLLALEPSGFRPQPYEQLARTYRAMGHDAFAREVLLAKERRRRSGLPRPARLWGHLQDAVIGYGYKPVRAAAWLAALVIVGTVLFQASPPRAVDPNRAPAFSAFVYTIDLMVPIIDFGQRKAYLSPNGWQQAVTYCLVALGWILATTIAAGLTRALRRQ